VLSSEDVSTRCPGNLALQLTIFVEKQARHVAVLEVLHTLGGLYHHKLPRWVLLCQDTQDLLEESSFHNAKKNKDQIL
jgi:hypothetical protein